MDERNKPVVTRGYVAGLVYIACLREGRKTTQHRIGSSLGVSEVCVRENYKRIISRLRKRLL
jgi:transcription initiation factor TFIIIB Brf1 subunit/transcription initiation factor TFIIB